MSEENNGPVEEPTETVSDASEESRPEVDGTDEASDEVVEQSETVGEEAAEDQPEHVPTPEEEEADRRDGIRRNFNANQGKKSDRKRQTNAASEPEDEPVTEPDDD